MGSMAWHSMAPMGSHLLAGPLWTRVARSASKHVAATTTKVRGQWGQGQWCVVTVLAS